MIEDYEFLCFPLKLVKEITGLDAVKDSRGRNSISV